MTTTEQGTPLEQARLEKLVRDVEEAVGCGSAAWDTLNPINLVSEVLRCARPESAALAPLQESEPPVCDLCQQPDLKASGGYVCAACASPRPAPVGLREQMLDALRACEENLRLIHEAAGPVPRGAPMPSHSTFGAWEKARDAIAAAEAP